MPRPSKIWWWESRGVWCAKINGKRINLGANKKEAQATFFSLKASPEQVVQSGTVWELMDRFLDWLSNSNRAKRTYDWYQDRLQWFKDGVPNMPVTHLRPIHIQEWIGKKKTWSDGHKRGVITAIKRVFGWAAKSGVISVSPIASLEKPEAGRRDRLLSPDDVNAIMDLTKDEAFKDLLTVVGETGCRPQEVVRVEARHFTGSTWRFPRIESKGKKRERIVFLTNKAVEICKKWAARFKEGPMFRNTKGQPWTAFSINCRFTRMQKKLGYKPCLYLFRHAYAHHAITEAGIDPVTTAALLGHTDTTMIYRTYGHLLKNESFMLAAAKKAKGYA